MPVALKVDGQYADAYPLPDPAFAKAKAVMPLSLDLDPYGGELDFSDIAHITGVKFQLCFIVCITHTGDAKEVSAFKRLRQLDRLREWAERNHTTQYVVGVGPQAVGGVTNTDEGLVYEGLRYQPMSVVEDDRPLTAVAHELGTESAWFTPASSVARIRTGK